MNASGYSVSVCILSVSGGAQSENDEDSSQPRSEGDVTDVN